MPLSEVEEMIDNGGINDAKTIISILSTTQKSPDGGLFLTIAEQMPYSDDVFWSADILPVPGDLVCLNRHLCLNHHTQGS